MKKFSFVILPMLFLFYLATELILKVTNSTLCSSDGCALTGTLLKFDAIYLNYLGLLSSLLLVILGLLVYKDKIAKKFFYFVLFASLIFEMILITYQYFILPEMCLFCLGVFGFLLLIALFTTKRYFLALIPLLGTIVMALSVLNFSTSSAESYKKVFIKDDGNYLIQWDQCGHCKKLKKYLNSKHIAFKKVDITHIQSQIFLEFIDIHKIPVLIVKEGNRDTIIHGNKKIIEYFESSKSLY